MAGDGNQTGVSAYGARRDVMIVCSELAAEKVQRTHVRPGMPEAVAYLSVLALRSNAYCGYSINFLEACLEELRYSAEQITDLAFCFAVARIDQSATGFHVLECSSTSGFELEALFVEPAWTGQGMGWMLLEHAALSVVRFRGSALVIQGDPHAIVFCEAASAVAMCHRESASIPGSQLPLFCIRLRDRDQE